MSTVHLQFPSLVYLSAFRHYAKATDWQIFLDTMSLQCACSPKVVKMALSDFRATLVTNEMAGVGSPEMAVA